MSAGAAFFGIVAHRNIVQTYFHVDFRARQVQFFAFRRNQITLFVEMRTFIQLRNVAFEFSVAEFHGVFLGNHARKTVDAEYFFHYVNAVRVDF